LADYRSLVLKRSTKGLSVDRYVCNSISMLDDPAHVWSGAPSASSNCDDLGNSHHGNAVRQQKDTIPGNSDRLLE
jgi:hypothetical protein